MSIADNIPNRLRENIASIRRMKGLSQQFMAQQLGIAEKQYSRWEIDPAKRNIEELENVAEVLDVTLSVLLGFDKQQFFEHCKQVYGNNNTYHESSE